MALILCPECGREISDKATFCPGCGCPVTFHVKGKLPPEIDIEEIMNIYENSTDGAIRYIIRTYGINEDESAKLVMDYYNKITAEKNSLLYDKIQKKNKKISKQIRNAELANELSLINKKIQNKKEEAQIVRCPKCHSTSITYDTKKLSIGRAIVGNAIAGAPGAILGGLSSKKGYAVCLNCGKRWKV